MPFAQFTGTGNGTTKQFTISFPYVKKDHIVVALNNVTVTGFTFINDTTIEFDTLSSATSTQETSGAPKNGVGIEITRDTPLTNALVDFVDGSTLTAGDLDTAVLQLLYGIQEAKDEAALGIQRTPQGQDAKNQQIINVSDPTNAQDAVTKAFLERVGSITSTQLADGTIVNADVSASAAIDGTKISPDFGSQNIATSGTVDGRDVSVDGTKLDTIETSAKDDQTGSEIKSLYEAESNTNAFTDALLAKLNAIEANATTDQTIAEIKALIAGSPLDASHLAADSVTGSELAANSVDSSELVDGSVDHSHLSSDCVDGDNIADNSIGSEHLQANSVGVSEIADAELSTLAGMQSGTASKLADSTALTSDIADLNQIDGLTKQTGNNLSDTDNSFPTSAAVVNYVAAQIAPIGGLEVIADDQSFPNNQPASGVVISIADAGGLSVDANGTSATARTANGTTVTINNFASNFNSSTVDAGVAIMVSSTGSGQVYNYHKATLKEADLLNLSNDINDFGNRYRVFAGEPTSDNHEGDLVYDKNADKMKVYDSTTNAFKEVTSVGDFKFLFLCPVGGSGSPTINGSIASYDLRESSVNGAAASVTSAAQLLVSINGVVQKANAGTSAPSEGFAMVDSNTIIFGTNIPSGAEVFVIQIGSAVSLQVPADDTVSAAKLQNGSVITAKLADQSVTLDKLLHGDSNSNGKFLRANNGADPSFETIDLTNLSATNLTSGTIPDARFPATLPAASAANLTSIPAGNLTGTVADARISSLTASKLTGALPAIDGSNLTGISSVGGATGVDFNDNVQARFGTDNDMILYHNDNDGQLANSKGNLILANSTDGEIFIDPKNNERGIVVKPDAGVEIYHNNIKKLESESSGINIISSTPLLNFNANNVAQAALIQVSESSGGGVTIFKNKETNGVLTESFRINTNHSMSFNGAGIMNSAKLNIANNGTHITCKSFSTGGYDSIFFRSANTNVGKIHFNSGGTQYHTSSDYRRKENIVDLTGAIDRVKLLQPKRFNFITDSSTTLDGFLAHEVTPAVPQAILGTKDQVATEKDVEEGRAEEVGDPIYQTIDQSTLIPLLTGALKEAIAKIETLETKVAALEGA